MVEVALPGASGQVDISRFAGGDTGEGGGGAVRDVTRGIKDGGVGPLGAGRDGEEVEQIVCFLFCYLFPLSSLLVIGGATMTGKASLLPGKRLCIESYHRCHGPSGCV